MGKRAKQGIFSEDAQGFLGFRKIEREGGARSMGKRAKKGIFSEDAQKTILEKESIFLVKVTIDQGFSNRRWGGVSLIGVKEFLIEDAFLQHASEMCDHNGKIEYIQTKAEFEDGRCLARHQRRDRRRSVGAV